jgi:hypothetical protein
VPRAGHAGAISTLQATHGNAFVARRLAAVARASTAKDDAADRERARGVFPGQRPPGYRPEGPTPALAKPACGVSDQLGNRRDPDFYPDHVQDSVHYVAHDLDIRTGATCEAGFAVGLKDLLAGLTRVPWDKGTFEDVWTDGARAGVVHSVQHEKGGGAIRYGVDVFEACHAKQVVVTGGWLYRKG